MPNPVRSKISELIKAEELVNKLQNSVLDPKQEPLGQNEVNCIKILLNKSLPDIKALEITGELDHNVTKKHRVSFRRS